MKPLVAIALCFAASVAQATDLLGPPPAGMSDSLLAPWRVKHPSILSVTPVCVNVDALDTYHLDVSIPGVPPVTFHGGSNPNRRPLRPNDPMVAWHFWPGAALTEGDWKDWQGGASTCCHSAVIERSGQLVSGDLVMNERHFQVVRFDSTCAGAVIEWRAPGRHSRAHLEHDTD